MITSYRYEGKTKEECFEKCYNELNLTEENLYIKENEQEGGLFKSKKYQIECYKKEDIYSFIKNYVQDISKGMNIEIKSEIREVNNSINIVLISNNNSILIGKDGKTLKSLQILLRQTLLAQTDINIKLNLDIANYKSKQIKNMKFQVKQIAKEVLKSHIDAKLDPMNSYERRIVHSIISEYEKLETESIGEEPNRCVLIKYKED